MTANQTSKPATSPDLQRGLNACADSMGFPHAVTPFDPLRNDAHCMLLERTFQFEVMPPWRDGGRKHWFVGCLMPDGQLMRFGAETRNEATCRCAAHLGEQLLVEFAKQAKAA